MDEQEMIGKPLKYYKITGEHLNLFFILCDRDDIKNNKPQLTRDEFIKYYEIEEIKHEN